MAPEIMVGCAYNYKVDIWALGTLLFNLLTGTYPFKGKNISELKDNLRKGAYKIPREVVVSLECIDFLNSCLKFDYSKRKDAQSLLDHPFLTKKQFDSIRKSKIISKATYFEHGSKIDVNIAKTSIELNTRNSVNFNGIFN